MNFAHSPFLLLSPVELLPHIIDVFWAQNLAWETCSLMLVNIASLEKLNQVTRCVILTSDLPKELVDATPGLRVGFENGIASTNSFGTYTCVCSDFDHTTPDLDHAFTHNSSCGSTFLVKLYLLSSLFLSYSRHEGC